jgi:ATP-binding cassette subfamily B protein
MNAKDVDLLRRSDLFRFLPDEHFERIRPLLQEERHDFGDLIVKQGDPASAFYILISGRARVVKSGASNGEEIVLATLRPGDSFGEAALTEGGTRTATVRCSTSVEVLRLDRAQFLALTETAPEFKEFPLRIQQFRATADSRASRSDRETRASSISKGQPHY